MTQTRSDVSPEKLRDYIVRSCGAEDLDELNPTWPEKKQRADFTFESRAVIVEMKSIDNQSDGKDTKIHPTLLAAHQKHGFDRSGYPKFAEWSEQEREEYKGSF